MENNIFEGFQFLTDSITGNGSTGVSSPVDNIVDPKIITGETEDDNDADDDIEVDPIIETNTTTDDKPITDSNDDDTESDVAELVQERLFKEFGWDIDEDKKFKSVKEVVDYVKDAVEAASVPDYSSLEVAELDEFVRNGGSISTYIEHTKGIESLDNINMDNDNDLKRVIKENLKVKGYSDERITKLLDRYEDNGTLKDEAEDAVELLKEHKEKEKETLLEDQRKQQEAYKRQQLDFVKGVETTIESTNTIRGVEVSKAEKVKLREYIFKPTADGRTQYQIDYANNKLSLIESAYFTMKGDTLVDKVKTKANSDAARRLKEKLADKGKRTNSQGSQDDDTTLWGTASRHLRKIN